MESVAITCSSAWKKVHPRGALPGWRLFGQNAALHQQAAGPAIDVLLSARSVGRGETDEDNLGSPEKFEPLNAHLQGVSCQQRLQGQPTSMQGSPAQHDMIAQKLRVSAGAQTSAAETQAWLLNGQRSTARWWSRGKLASSPDNNGQRQGPTLSARMALVEGQVCVLWLRVMWHHSDIFESTIHLLCNAVRPIRVPMQTATDSHDQRQHARCQPAHQH